MINVRIELQPDLGEAEVVIRCPAVTAEIRALRGQLAEAAASTASLRLLRAGRDHYLPLADILFFETEDGGVFAHTAADSYGARERLYELERMLPADFLRISKSAIVNTRQIRSVDRGITATSLISFYNTAKQIYASRRYLKLLQDRLQQRRHSNG